MKKKLTFILAKAIGFYLNVLSYFLPRQTAKIAYSLFSKPRKGKLKENHLPSIFAEAKREQLNDSQIYIWKGNQKIILLAHGWESNSSRWKKLLHQLRKNEYTVIAIDAPAHGLSKELILML
jgi:alpha-beta hydrolase superfamily lysophospholipase